MSPILQVFQPYREIYHTNYGRRTLMELGGERRPVTFLIMTSGVSNINFIDGMLFGKLSTDWLNYDIQQKQLLTMQHTCNTCRGHKCHKHHEWNQKRQEGCHTKTRPSNLALAR